MIVNFRRDLVGGAQLTAEYFTRHSYESKVVVVGQPFISEECCSLTLRWIVGAFEDCGSLVHFVKHRNIQHLATNTFCCNDL